MDEATNSQELDLDSVDAPEFDALVPDLAEMHALEGIDVEALAAEETADLELDMLELEPSISTAESSPRDPEPETIQAVESVASEEPVAEPDETPLETLPDRPHETAAPQSAPAQPAAAAGDDPTSPATSAETDKSRERISHIVFRIDEKRYAVEMQRLLELDRMTPVTPVPHTPDFILGVTNLRGEIVSVIDLRRLFGMPALDRPETGRLLKLRDRRELLISGVLVDAIQGARTIKPEQIRPASRSLGPKIVPLLQGVCDDGGEEVNVLDVDKLFESEQVRALTGA